MTNTEQSALMNHLVKLAKYYDKPAPTRPVLDLWLRALDSVPYRDICRALDYHARTSPYMPKIADITNFLAGDQAARCEAGWLDFLQAVARVGSYRNIRFTSPVAHYAIMRLGGWIELAESVTGPDDFKRGSFIEAWKVGERVANWENVPPYLAGRHEINNRGFSAARLVELGIERKVYAPSGALIDNDTIRRYLNDVKDERGAVRGLCGALPEPGPGDQGLAGREGGAENGHGRDHDSHEQASSEGRPLHDFVQAVARQADRD